MSPGWHVGYLFILAAWTKFLWSRFQGCIELIQILSSAPFSLKLQIKQSTTVPNPDHLEPNVATFAISIIPQMK